MTAWKHWSVPILFRPRLQNLNNATVSPLYTEPTKHTGYRREYRSTSTSMYRSTISIISVFSSHVRRPSTFFPHATAFSTIVFVKLVKIQPTHIISQTLKTSLLRHSQPSHITHNRIHNRHHSLPLSLFAFPKSSSLPYLGSSRHARPVAGGLYRHPPPFGPPYQRFMSPYFQSLNSIPSQWRIYLLVGLSGFSTSAN